MKVALVTQYFWPEQFIVNDLVRHLEAQGHYVRVLTGKPNYPEGEIYPGYSESLVQSEKYSKNIEINRAPLRPRKSGKLNLLKNYFSFVFNGLRYFPEFVKNSEFDAIIVFANSPITAAIPAILLKWKLKSHLAIWIQDLWPESLSATGYVQNKLILKIVGVLVKVIYYFADTLLVQSKAFFDPVSKYAPAKKIVYYPNSVDPSALESADAEKIPENILNVLETNFCFVFAGNIGSAQSVETIVGAAKLLKDIPEIRLVIVGSGSLSDWIAKQKKDEGLDILELPGRFPSSLMGQFFSRAKGLLVTLKGEEIFNYTVPCKVQSYLASGTPIIAALNGEGSRIINEAKAGLTCPAEDSVELASCIKQLYEMTDSEREQMGKNGLKYFEDNYEMSKQAGELIRILEQRILM